MRQFKVFTGSSHPELTALILARLGLPGSPALLRRFSNSEISVEIGESVRDCDVFIVQSGSETVNDHIMELLVMVNACKTASSNRITVM
jgi:ribose-phosphate pyrophosphokinase